MEAVVGIFKTRTSLEAAIQRLLDSGVRPEDINVLTPRATEEDLAEIPTTPTEQPGMGSAMGGVVGGAIGAAGGLSLGAAAASLLVPGVGPVMAIGIAAAAILGAGGAIGGAIAGDALEDSMGPGIGADELFVYEHALRQGKSVVIVFAHDHAQLAQARETLRGAGAESLDEARERWWIEVRDTEKRNYGDRGDGFDLDERDFRRGFEAALHPSARGRSYDEIRNQLRKHHPDNYGTDAFHRGFDRGQAHYRQLMGDARTSKRATQSRPE